MSRTVASGDKYLSSFIIYITLILSNAYKNSVTASFQGSHADISKVLIVSLLPPPITSSGEIVTTLIALLTIIYIRFCKDTKLYRNKQAWTAFCFKKNNISNLIKFSIFVGLICQY